MRNVEKLAGNLHGKKGYVVHIKTLKWILNQGLVWK